MQCWKDGSDDGGKRKRQTWERIEGESVRAGNQPAACDLIPRTHDTQAPASGTVSRGTQRWKTQNHPHRGFGKLENRSPGNHSAFISFIPPCDPFFIYLSNSWMKCSPHHIFLLNNPLSPLLPPFSPKSARKKRHLKIKARPECAALGWAPVLTDLLILAYLSPAIRQLTACYQPVSENVLQPD